MSHEVESMAFAHEVPWHGLGTRVSDAISVDDMLVRAGLDWTVSKRHMAVVSDRLALDVQELKDDRVGKSAVIGKDDIVPHQFALVRDTDKRILGVAGLRYHVAQNRDVLEFFRSFLARGDATLETAGSLKEGRLVWGLANLKQSFSLPGGDEVRGYLLLASPHECGKAIVARVTPTRVVCANTMAMAMSGTAKIEARFTHSNEFDPVLAGEAIQEVRDNLAQFERSAKVIRKLKVDAALAVQILAPVYQPKGVEGVDEYPAAGDLLVARDDLHSPTLAKVLECYRSAPGAQPGNGWGVLNGATYYADHVARKSADSRLGSAWLGREARRKTAVLDRLLELAA